MAGFDFGWLGQSLANRASPQPPVETPPPGAPYVPSYGSPGMVTDPWTRTPLADVLSPLGARLTESVIGEGGIGEFLPGLGDAMDARYAGEQVWNAGEAAVEGRWNQVAPFLAMASVAGMGALPGVDAPNMKGIRAYHGSPHDFDQFSLEKIGTGEGVQAFAHGLYFGDVSDTGRAYRDMLTEAPDMRVGGRPIEEVYSGLDASAAAMPPAKAQATYNKMALLEDLMNGGDVLHVREQAARGAYDDATMAWFEKNVAPSFTRKGRLYEVNINASPDEFYDLDTPIGFGEETTARRIADEAELIADNDYGLYQVRDQVQRAIDDFRANPADATIQKKLDRFLRKANREYGLNEMLENWGRTVADTYKAREVAIGAEAAARELTEQGYKGVKYLDQGSRVAGEGTRNYVVFDDSLIDIIRKYGIAGLLALPGLAMMGSDSEAQASE